MLAHFDQLQRALWDLGLSDRAIGRHGGRERPAAGDGRERR
jgi:hypothetical protein